VVVETRYVDLDYRSEYSGFFSRTFANHPDSAHRLHFFRDEIRSEDLTMSDTSSFGRALLVESAERCLRPHTNSLTHYWLP
jgi:hypothetical protein